MVSANQHDRSASRASSAGSAIPVIPVVAVVGKGDSGKTTFVEKIVRELTARGVRVATVKHHLHDYEIDVPGKDSWRHARAGSVVAMVSSPEKFSMVRRVERELSLDEIAEQAAAAECQILIAEGYKVLGVDRIEVSRLGRSSEPLSGVGDSIAIVTDNPNIDLPGTPLYGLDDAVGVADFLHARYLGVS